MKIPFEIKQKEHDLKLIGCLDEGLTIIKILLIVPDINEQYGRYDELAGALAEKGVVTLRYDLPNLRDSQLSFTEEFLVSEFLGLMQFLLRRYPNTPIEVMGIGIGAWVALTGFNHCVNDINHVYLVSPYELNYSLFDRIALKKLSLTQPHMSSDWMKKADEYYKSDHYWFAGLFPTAPTLSNRQVVDMNQLVMKAKRLNLSVSDLEVGFTIILGEKDGLIDRKVIDKLVHQLKASEYYNVEAITLKHQKHDCMLSQEGVDYLIKHLFD